MMDDQIFDEHLRKRLEKLESELVELDGRKAKVERDINAICILLPDEDQAQVHSTSLNGSSLNGQMRKALLDIGQVASPSDVTNRMVEDGFRWSGKTKLQILVSSALHKMAQRHTGGVHRVERGQYVIKEQEK